MSQVKSERNYLFDNIKAILIFLVVASHYLKASGSFDPSSLGGFFYIIAFAFIMQGFIFISGYFSKKTLKCKSTAVRSFLFPYLVLMPIMYFLRLIIFGKARFLIILPTHSLWFLLVLFVYRYWLHNLKDVKHLGLFSLVSYFIAGFFPFLNDILALGRIFSFFLFFYMGYCFKWEYIEKIRKIKKPYILALLAALLAIAGYISHNELFHVDLWQLKDSWYHFGLNAGEGLLLRLLILVVSLGWLIVLFNLVPDKKLPFSVIGQRTMTIFACHIPFRYLIKYYNLPGESDILTYTSCLIITTIVVFIFSRTSVVKKYDQIMNFLYENIFAKFIQFFKRIYLTKKES